MKLTAADRLYCSLLACITGISLCFSAAARSSPASSELCDAIAHELNDAYIEGVISRSDAIEVIDRCFSLTEL